jgi:hypothetical protein
MEYSANIIYPNASPLWCNTTPGTASVHPLYDGAYFYYWAPRRDYTVWFDTPIMQEELAGGNVCYRLQGNVWFCPSTPESELPPEVVPLPTNAHIKPTITITSARMENHAEHVSVMFGQVISNLK